jgi:16S rRNA (cytosine967-C5)-methyltransferase
MKPRLAAFTALLSAMQDEGFITDRLEDWSKKDQPDGRDYGLALEIASGSCRRGLTLDEIARQLTESGSLKLKLKERALLRTALYQRYFMDRVPLHAIVNETVEIAKMAGMQGKCAFFNALLRKTETFEPQISEKNWHLSESMPQPLIDAFVAAFGSAQTKTLLKVFNHSFPPMARKIGNIEYVTLNSPEEVKKAARSDQWYIQNITPGLLVKSLNDRIPSSILDLCASPGGKLLLAHDLYPQAELYANDLTEGKLKTLKENLGKYHLKATLTLGKGEEYPQGKLFDLIIIDAPCSNTGVLNKRPEARYRYQAGQFHSLQSALIGRAKELLSPKGVIWYLTCSLLPEENRELVESACKTFDLKLIKDHLELPDETGKDGGYGALLTHND